jgi:eukaryotic-like serine/threonine-protein kinase
MHESSITSTSSGVIIQGRYLVVDTLGKGGFSTVYLVRDQDADKGEEGLFALKELRGVGESERVSFTFEGEVLTRLNHASLPRIYQVFKGDEQQHAFMLLEYIAGPNLELLRRRQSEHRFAVAEVVTLLGPIVEAITYLHTKQPPIVHRDIKPANIIVPEAGGRAVLVDFGIAKEYDVDATTSAIRHCSPGYGAPEHYSGSGTSPRTDIYGLGATCYTLLTGTPPPDALRRATLLASKHTDPLIPINELDATIPTQVSAAVARAMAIGQEQRFASVEEFWQALTTYRQQIDAVPPSSSETSDKQTPAQATWKLRPFARPVKPSMLVTLFLTLLILLGIASGILWYKISDPHSISSTAHSVSPTLAYYPHIASAYAGTIHDMLKQDTTNMFLVHVRQDNSTLNGSFTGLHTRGMFTGVLDTSKHIFFTVAGSSSRSPLFFEGAVLADNNLTGNYCTINSAGQCVGNYGIWSVGPQTASG